ncbi:MAG: RNB domain-containing ribonuclease [Desulfobacterales bacterium]
MKSGTVIEFIDRQRIVCAAVQNVKTQRLQLLTETDREINLPPNRVAHACDAQLSVTLSRDQLVTALKEIVRQRQALAEKVAVQDIWDVLNSEQEWVDLSTMTSFCFDDSISCHHEAAVVRAFFANRIYFKFDGQRFFPHTPQQVEQLLDRQREEARRIRITHRGGLWLSTIRDQDPLIAGMLEDEAVREYVAVLQSFFLFGKESPHYTLGKAMVKKAGIDPEGELFRLLVRLKVFEADANLDLLRLEIPQAFPQEVDRCALERNAALDMEAGPEGLPRRDFTDWNLMTIDGQMTLDYDDAISIQRHGEHVLVGVHIMDVGQVIGRDDPVDREAFQRASSIYMPDQKIPMLPACLSDDLCSLKADQRRPAISTLIEVDTRGQLVGYSIVPSLVIVKRQLTYYEVNGVSSSDPDIEALHHIAQVFRKQRLDAGGVHISLPEVSIWLDEQGEVKVHCVNRESPARMLVAELMIMANWLMARHLTRHDTPAIFRSQPEPRERLYQGEDDDLFRNCMQRRKLSRFILGPFAEHHHGLGLESYVTATSPIRKYADLVTQRQIRAILGLEPAYSQSEIEAIIQHLAEPMAAVGRVQFRRQRYWLLKYIQGRIGAREEGLVLQKRRHGYQILLPRYMLEGHLAVPDGTVLKPAQQIQVVIQHADPRKDLLHLYLS